MFLSKSLKFILSLLLAFVLLGCDLQTEPKKMPRQTLHVDTLTLAPLTLRLTNELPGRISAFKEAEVRPQVSGILTARLFEEGSFVKSGDVLYQIDSTVYQALVNSAQAQLNKAISSEETAQKSVVRYQALLKKKLSSQELYDEANSVYQQTKADVAFRQAELDYATIQLSYTQVKAPISGRVGISNVSDGSLLTAGQSSYLTTIIQSDKVYVDMKQSSVSLYKLQQEFNSKFNQEPNSESIDRPSVPVTVTLEDGTQYDQIGQLTFSDTQVSDSTGSVTLRAVIPNPNFALLPGMFVRAHISLPEEKEYLIVPQSTVIRSQSGEPSVFIVNDDGMTEKKSVVLSREVGNGWVVENGLKVGDHVIVSNLLRVKNNQAVIVDTNDVNVSTF